MSKSESIIVNFHPRKLRPILGNSTEWDAERLTDGWKISGPASVISKISQEAPKEPNQARRKNVKKPKPVENRSIPTEQSKLKEEKINSIEKTEKKEELQEMLGEITFERPVLTDFQSRIVDHSNRNSLDKLRSVPFSELTTEDRYAFYKLDLGKEAVYHGRITNIYRTWKAEKLIEEAELEKESANQDQVMQNIEDKKDIILGEIDTLYQNIQKCEVSIQAGQKIELSWIKNIHSVFETVRTLSGDFVMPPNISEDNRKSILEDNNKITRKIQEVNQKIKFLDKNLKQQQNRTYELQGNPADLKKYLEKMEKILGISKTDSTLSNRLEIIQQKIDEIKSLKSQIEQ
jgi:hypothetical protein